MYAMSEGKRPIKDLWAPEASGVYYRGEQETEHQ